MMLLGLVLHSFISYGEAPLGEAWPFKDEFTHPVADWIVIVIHVFRMPIFFAMAGFFAAMLYLRRGPIGLARNRASRILLPFGVSWIVLWPPILLGFVFAGAAKTASVAEGFAVASKLALVGPFLYRDSTAHLWFLYYLLWFYAVFLAVAPAVRRLPERWRRAIPNGYARLMRGPLRPLWFAVPTALTLWLTSGGRIETSTSFVPNLGTFLAYIFFFTFGWLLYLRRELLPTFQRHAWLQVLAALPLIPVNQVALERFRQSLPAGDAIVFAVAVVSGALMMWLLVFGITGLFLKYLDRPVPVVRYVVDASYWLYLIHLPFTIWVPGLLTHLPWPGLLKALAVLAISSPIWLASYHFLVRSTFVGKVLNGRRYPRSLPAIS
jgi:fucose 4-O-acetylase-like acetyltransferase